MYKGEIVEEGSAGAITSAPEHPYTQRLLLAAPVPDPVEQAKRRHERHAVINRQKAAS